jgi:hypothetical protein
LAHGSSLFPTRRISQGPRSPRTLPVGRTLGGLDGR